MKAPKLLILSACVLGLVGLVKAEEVFKVVQKNKAFSVKHLVIQQGDRVEFPNQDDVYHNVYSLSEAKTFDLGSYGKGPGKSVTFDRKGEVQVNCAIHPQMQLTIEVR
ncbi:MAG: plastocyanin/azurin family copper-binding protein [bacterium]|nr:plastocyanin/azurin family copper-binding protein [bacterium]